MSDASTPSTPSANTPGAATTPGTASAQGQAQGTAQAQPQQPNPAQEAFGKYRTRLGVQPVGTPWGSAGWPPQPPSMMPGSAQAAPHVLGSLSTRLGSTLRLSFDLLNATLASAAHALGGIAALDRRGGYEGGCGCGCEDGYGHHECCGHDCCRPMGRECCRPTVHGCGCGD
jgi:hypothetical protein